MSKLTAYELIDLAASMYANSATMYAILLTIVSGYLVVAYIAGAKLKRGQVVIVNALFLITCLTTIAALASFSQVAQEFAMAGVEARGREGSLASYFSSYFIFAIDFLIIISCLKFMWDVRHPKTE